MLEVIFILLLLFIVNQFILGYFKGKHPFLSISLLNILYFFHSFFWLVYYIYATYNPSDSKAYFRRTSSETYYTSWFDIFGTDIRFIDFVAFPFVNKLGFSYEAIMFLFSWFGYLGFIYFYIYFKESIKQEIKFLGYNLIVILLFLPNMHFWTASLGKGSLIFLGIGMFAYAMRVPQKRLLTLFFSSIIVYCIRPHIFMFLGIGAVIGYLTGQDKVPLYQKVLVYIAFVGGIYLQYDQILAVANINEESMLESFQDFSTTRAGYLENAGSGVDMTSYSLPFKLFTFWFRPLFVDAPGALGLYISLENMLYLILALKVFDKDFVLFLKKSSSLVKMSLVIFLSSSIALSFVMSNLGLVIRQKSMVMYFFFFVILAFMEYKQQKKRSIPENGEEISILPQKRIRLV